MWKIIAWTEKHLIRLNVSIMLLHVVLLKLKLMLIDTYLWVWPSIKTQWRKQVKCGTVCLFTQVWFLFFHFRLVLLACSCSKHYKVRSVLWWTDPSRFLSTFDMGQLGKILNSAGKRAFKLVRLRSLKTNEDITRQVKTFYRRLYGGGHKLAPHHTNVCKFSQLCWAISLLAKDVSLSNLAVLLILRRSFQCCRRIFS